MGRGQMIDSDDEEEEFRQVGVPRILGDVRPAFDGGREMGEEWDWAGVEGRWTRIVCFMLVALYSALTSSTPFQKRSADISPLSFPGTTSIFSPSTFVLLASLLAVVAWRLSF